MKKNLFMACTITILMCAMFVSCKKESTQANVSTSNVSTSNVESLKAQVFDDHIDVCGPFEDTNPCNGSTITTTGCFGIDVHSVVNGNTVTLSYHISSPNVRAVDDQGNTYNAIQNENQTFTGSFNNGQLIVNDVAYVRFISKGSAPNYTLRFTFHITFNANGTITVVRGDASIECHG
jgi:hypothetical protein